MLPASYILLAMATAVAGKPTPGNFTSQDDAFLSGMKACEQFYPSGPIPADAPGPFTDNGFPMSDIKTENPARVRMLVVGQRAHVFRARFVTSSAEVYAALTESPLLCRVGSFDVASHVKAMAYYASAASGWTKVETASQTPGVGMQRFTRTVDRKELWINVSWIESGTGPNGLTAMASMFIEPK